MRTECGILLFRSDIVRQKEMIKGLKSVIETLERDKLIDSFNFNHYYSTPPNPKIAWPQD